MDADGQNRALPSGDIFETDSAPRAGEAFRRPPGEEPAAQNCAACGPEFPDRGREWQGLTPERRPIQIGGGTTVYRPLDTTCGSVVRRAARRVDRENRRAES